MVLPYSLRFSEARGNYDPRVTRSVKLYYDPLNLTNSFFSQFIDIDLHKQSIDLLPI